MLKISDSPMKRFPFLRFFLCLCLSGCMVCAFAQNQSGQTGSKGKKAPVSVYAFGYGEALNDSAVFLSPIQLLEGVELEKGSGFLQFRETYSNQMQRYLDRRFALSAGTQPLGSSHKPHAMCVIIYGKKRADVEKKYVKLRKDIRKRRHVRLTEMPVEEFQFVVNPDPYADLGGH